MNDENLIPLNKRTKSEQREITSKGGKASGVSRGIRSTFKRRLRENPELFDQLFDLICEMAFKEHNLKAAELFVELSGESSKQMELALKKQELKLKKQAMQTGAPGEQELPALMAALEGDE